MTDKSTQAEQAAELLRLVYEKLEIGRSTLLEKTKYNPIKK